MVTGTTFRKGDNESSEQFTIRSKVPEELLSRNPQPVETPNIEAAPLKYVALALVHLRNQINSLAKMAEDNSRPVDEYSTQTLSPESYSSLTIQPNWEPTELIESIVITGPASNAVNATGQVFGTATDPGAGGTIVAFPTIPAGTYQVSVTAYLSGTVAAGDANNMQLTGANGLTIPVPPAANVPVTITQTIIVGPNTNLAVKAIGAASGVAAIYNASLSITAVSLPTTFTLQLGDRVWDLTLPSSGVLVISPVKLFLSRSDNRVLTSPTSGEWTLELMGHCDDRAG